MAIDIDHRVTKQQYTSLLPLDGIKGGRKTSCMACQQKKRLRTNSVNGTTGSKSYKASMIVIYESRIANMSNLQVTTTLEAKFTSEKLFIRLVTG